MAGYKPVVATLCATISTAVLMTTFRNKRAMETCFLIGAVLMLSAWSWLYSLTMLPFYVIFLATPLEAFSLRNTMALILGMLAPLWIALPIALYILWQMPENTILLEKYEEYTTIMPLFNYTEVDELSIMAFVILTFIFLLQLLLRQKSGHCSKKYERVQRNIYSVMFLATAVFAVIMPTTAPYTISLMTAFLGPVVALRMADDSR